MALTHAGVGFFVFDSKEITINERSFLSVPGALGVGLISEKQVLIIDSNRKLLQYVFSHRQMKYKSEIDSPIKLEAGEKISKVWIKGSADDEKDAEIIIFFAVICSVDKKTKMKIKIQ